MNVKRPGFFSLLLVCGHSLMAAMVTEAEVRLTVEVPSGEDYVLSSADVSALNGRDLYKTGAGRLIISTDLKTGGWDGEIVVEEGYLRTAMNGALGGVDKGTTIRPGATLEIEDNSASYTEIHPGEPFKIGGSGVGGYGAVYATRSGPSTRTNMMFTRSNVTLTADTTVGYSGTEGFDGSCGFRASTIDMGGFALTFTKGANHGLYGGSVANPGRIEVEDRIGITLENNVNLGDHPEYTLYLGDGVSLNLQNMGGTQWNYEKSGWTLETKGDATITILTADPSGWYGPMKLGGKLTVKGSKKPGTFNGPISGPGSIVIEGGTDYFENKSDAPNSFTGGFTLNSGTAYLTGLASVPSAAHGGISGVKGTVCMTATQDEEITDDLLYGIWQGITTNATQPAFARPSDYNLDTHRSKLFDFKLDLGRDHLFSKTIEDAITVYHASQTGTLTVDSEMTGLPNFINYAGALKFDGADEQKVSWVDVRGGTVEIASGAELNLASNAYVCAAYPNVARLKISGGYAHADSGGGTRLARNLASGEVCGRGIMEILDGAVVEESFPGNQSCVPNGWGDDERLDQGHAKSVASFYQRGGIFRTVQGVDNHIGEWLGAYYSLEGGLLHLRSTTRLAGRKRATAIFHQRGGSCLLGAGFNSACAGRPVWHYISGGTMIGTNTVYEAVRQDFENRSVSQKQGYNALAVLTVDGSDALCELYLTADRRHWQSILVLASQHYSRGQVNLLAEGTLRCNGIKKASSALIDNVGTVLTGNIADVSFNGGVLAPNCYRSELGAIFRSFDGDDDHVRAFAGGAIIDTEEGHEWSLGAPLEAPEGNGVDSIPLPDGIVNARPWEFTAAPTVEIVDPTGVGTGATAVAIFDTVQGRVTGIKIMNRGNNYSAANAHISRGGHTNSWTVAAIVTPNVSGGFEKRGSGTLIVDKVCSYTGITRVSGGTLKLSVDAAIDASSGITLSGGTLDADSKSFNVPVCGGYGNVIGADIVRMTDDMVFDSGHLLSGSSISVDGVVSIPDGATVSVRDFGAVEYTTKRKFRIIAATGGITGDIPSIDVELAKDGWSIVLSSDGKEMFVYKPKGLKIIFR